MKHSIFAMLAALCAATLTSSCSTSANHVSRHPGQPTNAAQLIQAGERFKNLYPTPKQFPQSCEQDCYQADTRVNCQLNAERCQVKWPALPAIMGLQLQWVGHASFRLQTPQGQLLLLDPVSADFDWPINWLGAIAGSKRTAPTAPLLAANQAANAVFYSHAHYDHFNKSDISSMAGSATIFMPFGMADYLPAQGLRVHEMAWYSSYQHANMTIHFTPAHHYSGRSLYELDGDKSLWGGWVLDIGGQKLFFAGDTGYSPIFRDIRQKLGPMSVCLLPIGSYHGKHYRNAHLAPEDALTVASELGCKRVIPWGYGNHSWLMGDKSSHSALLRLLTMHRRMQSATELQILNEGDIVDI